MQSGGEAPARGRYLRAAQLASTRNARDIPVSGCPLQDRRRRAEIRRRRRLAEEVQRRAQIGAGFGIAQSRGESLFAEFLALRIYDHRNMGIKRFVDVVRWLQLRRAQAALQKNLPRCRIEQIRSAHDMRHALRGIVEYHRQLIRRQLLLAKDNEVADLAQILFDMALHRIVETDRDGVDPESYRMRRRGR